MVGNLFDSTQQENVRHSLTLLLIPQNYLLIDINLNNSQNIGSQLLNRIQSSFTKFDRIVTVKKAPMLNDSTDSNNESDVDGGLVSVSW